MEDELDILKYIPDRHRRVIERFLLENWSRLAFECYGNYLEKGRGMMTVFMAGDTLDLMYVSWSWLQDNWDRLLGDADRSIQNSIRQLLPDYNPDDECVLLFEFDDGEPSAVIRVTRSVFSWVSQRPGAVVPGLHRLEGLTPKEAYEALSVGKKRSAQINQDPIHDAPQRPRRGNRD